MSDYYMDYEEYLLRSAYISKLGYLGIGFYFRKNKLKIATGISCLILGSVPGVPFFVFYPLGFFLLGMSMADIPLYKEQILRKIKKFYILKRRKVLLL